MLCIDRQHHSYHGRRFEYFLTTFSDTLCFCVFGPARAQSIIVFVYKYHHWLVGYSTWVGNPLYVTTYAFKHSGRYDMHDD